MSTIRLERLENPNTSDGGIDIDSSGKVGIATDNPGTRLDVISTASASTPISRFKSGTTAGDRGVEIASDANSNVFIQTIRGSDNASNYQLCLNPNGGNVGIGESNPSAGLHVVTDVNPVLKLDRGSANAANANWYYNGTFTGQLSAANQNFQISASGGVTPISFYTNGSERMKIDSTGSIKFRNYNDLTTLYNISTGYGITISHFTDASIQIARTNDQMLLLNRLGSNGRVAGFYRSGAFVGGIEVTTTNTSYQTSSDYRLKENIVPVTDGIDRLKQLNPSRFNFIVEPSKTVDGFIAHEVQGIVPEAVSGQKDAVEIWKEGDDLPDGVSVGDNKLDEDGNTIPAYQGIDQSKLVPLLTAALQEAIAKIETLEAKVAALEAP